MRINFHMQTSIAYFKFIIVFPETNKNKMFHLPHFAKPLPNVQVNLGQVSSLHQDHTLHRSMVNFISTASLLT